MDMYLNHSGPADMFAMFGTFALFIAFFYVLGILIELYEKLAHDYWQWRRRRFIERARHQWPLASDHRLERMADEWLRQK